MSKNLLLIYLSWIYLVDSTTILKYLCPFLTLFLLNFSGWKKFGFHRMWPFFCTVPGTKTLCRPLYNTPAKRPVLRNLCLGWYVSKILGFELTLDVSIPHVTPLSTILRVFSTDLFSFLVLKLFCIIWNYFVYMYTMYIIYHMENWCLAICFT